MAKILKPALICFLAMTVLCGILYTGAVTGIAQLVFPEKAKGSIITIVSEGTKKAYGSRLIGQTFTEPQYLIGRPAGVSNLSPVGLPQKKSVDARILWHREFNGTNGDIPMDLVTGSGSGVDPYISVAAAEFQVLRIAKVRGIGGGGVRQIIKGSTTSRFLGVFGEPGVNVLEVNLRLDGLLLRSEKGGEIHWMKEEIVRTRMRYSEKFVGRKQGVRVA